MVSFRYMSVDCIIRIALSNITFVLIETFFKVSARLANIFHLTVIVRNRIDASIRFNVYEISYGVRYE